MRRNSSTPRSLDRADRHADARRHDDDAVAELDRLAQRLQHARRGRLAARRRRRRSRRARRTRRRRAARRCRPRAGRRSAGCATSCSSRSPSACPRVSLIDLKSSRSTNSTPTCASARAPRVERVLDAVVEERAVGQPGERVVERAVAQLLLEGLAVLDVAHGEHDALDARVVEQAGGRGGDVPVGAVGVAHPPLGLLRRVGLLGHAGTNARTRAASSACTQSSSGEPSASASQSAPKIGATEPVSIRSVPSGATIMMQSDELPDDRLQPLAALLGGALELERVLDPAAPLVGEERQQAAERQHRERAAPDARRRPARPGSRSAPGRRRRGRATRTRAARRAGRCPTRRAAAPTRSRGRRPSTRPARRGRTTRDRPHATGRAGERDHERRQDGERRVGDRQQRAAAAGPGAGAP